MEGIVARRCERTCDRYSFFDKGVVEKLTGLYPISKWTPNNDQIEIDFDKAQHVASMDKFDCIICKISLLNLCDMKAHFKSPEHVKQFRGYLDNTTDILGVSDEISLGESDPESLDSSENMIPDNLHSSINTDNKQKVNEKCLSHEIKSIHGRHLLLFRNKENEKVGILRCLLYSKCMIPQSIDDLLQRVSFLRHSRFWAFLLYSGGKFAGGIFDQQNELVHKTLQRYTVRAKQGGSQSSRDASSGNLGGPKSAGATLRRHGERAIRLDISQLLHVKWRPYLQACQLIFTWTTKAHQDIFFVPPRADTSSEVVTTTPLTPLSPADSLAGEAVALHMGFVQGDPRLRKIPFHAGRVTYSQIKELHKEFSIFRVYDSIADPSLICLSERRQLENFTHSGNETLFKSKTGRLFYGQVSDFVASSEEVPRGASNLCQSEASASGNIKRAKKRKHKKHRRPNPPGQQVSQQTSVQEGGETVAIEELCSTYACWHRAVRIAIATGDLEGLNYLLNFQTDDCVSPPPSVEASALPQLPPSTDSPGEAVGTPKSELKGSLSPGLISSVPTADEASRLLNYPLADGRSLLHLAVELQRDPQVIHRLLLVGCLPDSRDSNGMTPYRLAVKLNKKKLSRGFYTFRCSHPERYNYDTTEIPVPTNQMQDANKSGQDHAKQGRQKNVQKNKSKSENVITNIGKPVATPKISDEFASTGSPTTAPLRTCDECARDITGKIPFTYLEFSFCSPSCLRSHRFSNMKLTP